MLDGIGIGSGAAPGSGDEAGGSSRAVLRQTRTIRDAIVGGVLKERDGELAAMAHFCADPDASYLIWDADEWSGASSLLATFVAEPPASVDVVAFVVDGGDAQARTADRFLAAVAAQLEEYLGVPREGSVPAVPGAARARYEPLLREASAAARTAGRHLVLIVDALDEEDVDFTGLEPITTLLGARVPGLHVIAAMRPDGPAAELAREDDTLCEVVPVELAPFLDGAQLRRAAEEQVRSAAAGDDPAMQAIVGFLLAAEDALTAAELAELIGDARFAAVTAEQVRTRLHSGLHRAVRARWRPVADPAEGDVEPVYGWAHGTLPAVAREMLSQPFKRRCTRRLHKWADTHAQRGWTQATPGYLDSGYPALLRRTSEHERHTGFALDQARHDWLRSRRGTDEHGLAEIAATIEMSLRRRRGMDTAVIPRLASERLRLLRRAAHPTPESPQAGGVSGPHDARDDPDTVEALTSFADALVATRDSRAGQWIPEDGTGVDFDGRRALVLAAVARLLASAGHSSETRRVVGLAQQAASGVPNTFGVGQVLGAVARAWVTAGDLDQARSVVDAISDPHSRDDALREVVHALIDVGNLAQAEAVAADLDDRARRVRALIDVGNLAQAEAVAADLDDRAQRVHALVDVAEGWAAAGHLGEVERIAGTLAASDTPGQFPGQFMVVFHVAQALAAAGNDAAAEQLAGTLGEINPRLTVLRAVAQALARAKNTSAAQRIASQAHALADTAGDDDARAWRLVQAALALAAAGETAQARLLAAEAERLANALPDQSQRDYLISEVAQAWATTATAEQAQAGDR